MIGNLRHRITFQEESLITDAGGGQALSWANISTDPTVWAEIRPLRGSEALRAEQLEDKVTHKITVRARTDITAAMRITFGSRAFNIRSIRNLEERDKFTEIMVEEGVAI